MTESGHLLIVDDDDRICRLLSRYLEREGFQVGMATDGGAMWKYLENHTPDLIILDVMLPGVDGITLARELRSKKSNLGIIMLTGKDDPIDTIVGLEVGADDYMTKPFENRELLARIRSVMRRLSANGKTVTGEGEVNDSSGNVVSFEGWRMNMDAYELTSPEGEEVKLTTHEFRLLEIFVQHAGAVLSRDQIMQQLSHREWMLNDRSIDVLIGKLRKKIEANPADPKLIHTIRNAGYQFIPKVRKA